MKNIKTNPTRIWQILICFFAFHTTSAQVQDPCDPDRTNTPVITHDFCGLQSVTSISGTSDAGQGASIELLSRLSVFDHPVSIGTTTVDSNGDWQITGINLNAGLISATAQADGELLSEASAEIEIKLPPNILVSLIEHPTLCGVLDGGFELSGFSPFGLVDVYFNNEGQADTVSVTANALGQVSIAQMPAGEYTDIYAVVDGCVTNTICNVSLEAPLELPLALGVSVPPVLCGGNGTIKLVGGFIPLQSYQVTYFDGTGTVGPTSISADLTGIINVTVSSGTYSRFQVSDGNCSTGTLNESVTMTDGLLPDVVTVGTITQPTSCTATDGSVDLTGLQALSPIEIYYEDEDGNQQSIIDQTTALGTFTITGLQEGELRNLRIENPITGCTSNPLATIRLYSLSEISLLSSSSPTSCAVVDGSIRLGGALSLQSYGVSFELDGNVQPTVPVTADVNGEIELTGLVPGEYANIYLTQGYCESNILSDIIELDEIEVPEISVGSFYPPNLCTGEDGEIKLLGLPLENKVYDVSYDKGLDPVVTSIQSENGIITIPGLQADEYTDFSVAISGCSSNTVACTIDLSQASNELPQISLQSSFDPTNCQLDDGHIRLIQVLQNRYFNVIYTIDEVQYTESILSDSLGVLSINDLVAGDYTDLHIEYNGCVSNSIPRVSLTDLGLSGVYVSSFTTPTVCGLEDATLEISGLITGVSYNVEAELEGAAGMQIGLGQFQPSDVGKLVVTDLSAGLYKNIRVSTNSCLSVNLGSVDIECFRPAAFAVSNVTIDLLTNGYQVAVPTDPDGDIICAEISVGSLPSGLAFDQATGIVSVSNQLNLSVGSYTFTIESTDEKGHTSETEITIEILNDTPDAMDDAYSLDEAATLNVAAGSGVLANDVDFGNNGLTVTLITAPNHAASFTLNSDGSFDFQHNGTETISDSLVYEVSDGLGESAQAKVLFTINPFNDPPSISEAYFDGEENTDVAFTQAEFENNYQDLDGDALHAIRFESLPPSGEGEVKLNGNPVSINQEILVSDIPNLVFSPVTDFFGTVNFTWNASDGTEYSESAESVIVEIDRTNTAPTAQDKTITILEDEIYVILKADFGFSDPDGDAFTQVTFETIPSNGTLKVTTPFGSYNITPGSSLSVANIDAGRLAFIPGENENGSPYDSFDFQVHDDMEAQSGQNTITFNVTSVDDAPIAMDDEYEFSQNVALTVNATEGVLANDQEVDGETLTATLQTSTMNGSLVFNTDGSFTYTPTTGNDSFSYTISDGTNTSQVAWVFLNEEANRRVSSGQNGNANPKDSKRPTVTTVVSPNGDGQNDSWRILGIEDYPQNIAWIYDQTGRLVSEIQGYDNLKNVWKGEGATKTEVFYYVLQLDQNDILRGKILVQR